MAFMAADCTEDTEASMVAANFMTAGEAPALGDTSPFRNGGAVG